MFDDIFWIRVNDGNRAALRLYLRHYTAPQKETISGYVQKNAERFGGHGETLILLSPKSDALFVWRYEKYRLDQLHGINCAIFRNESEILSSKLILRAEILALEKWPQAKMFFTFINPEKISSSNPGFCFKCAGWKFSGITKKQSLHILAKNMLETLFPLG